jgi:methionine aminopeptidase
LFRPGCHVSNNSISLSQLICGECKTHDAHRALSYNDVVKFDCGSHTFWSDVAPSVCNMCIKKNAGSGSLSPANINGLFHY